MAYRVTDSDVIFTEPLFYETTDIWDNKKNQSLSFEFSTYVNNPKNKQGKKFKNARIAQIAGILSMLIGTATVAYGRNMYNEAGVEGAWGGIGPTITESQRKQADKGEAIMVAGFFSAAIGVPLFIRGSRKKSLHRIKD